MPAPAKPQPSPLGRTIEGEVTDLAFGASGVVRADGWVVMISGAFPGDRIRARLRRRRRGVIEGELLEVLAPSPERIPPACPHVALCGGCALQGLAPAAQTHYKAAQAVELLRRIGRVSPGEIATPWRSPRAWYYRNKMEFTFATRPWIPREELAAGLPFPAGPALGLHPRGRYEGVFDVADCRLQSPLSNQIVAGVRAFVRERGLTAYVSHNDTGLMRHLVIRQAATRSDLLLVLVVRREEPALQELARELCAAFPAVTGVVACLSSRRAMVAQGERELLLAGQAAWGETVRGLDLQVGAAGFFQTQTAGAEALAAEVCTAARLHGSERVLDLYCGVGTLSLPVAQQAAHVLGVEVAQEAVACAQENARRNGIGNADFACDAVESARDQSWEREPWDLVILDPPRSGLHPQALEKVSRLHAPRIVYVSCNPATLARDAAALVHETGYVATRLRVLDLFPQTPHLESVLVLERA